jgi:hypothetical protein
VRVGELCHFDGILGTVEEVGLRSTRVRTVARTVVTIPNAEFSNLQIENLARRDRIWYHPTLGLHYEFALFAWDYWNTYDGLGRNMPQLFATNGCRWVVAG